METERGSQLRDGDSFVVLLDEKCGVFGDSSARIAEVGRKFSLSLT